MGYKHLFSNQPPAYMYKLLPATGPAFLLHLGVLFVVGVALGLRFIYRRLHQYVMFDKVATPAGYADPTRHLTAS